MEIYNNKYLIGLDLGQQNDYSVLSVLNVDFGASEDLLYKLCMLKRFALKTNYMDIVEECMETINSFGIRNNCVLVIDYTGVGHPVFDYFRIKGMRPMGISITGGMRVNQRDDNTISVPKKDIVTYLQMVIQTRRLRIPADLKFLKEMREEFMGFKFKVNEKAHGVFEAGAGFHDDIVLSLGIAIWAGEYHSRKKLKAITGR